MSRKSSWWLRQQRKGASNRAALNEANYFMEHNKVLRERIKELAAENAKLRELVRHMYECMGNIDADGNYECDSCEYDNEEGKCDYERRMRELGIEVD